MGEHMNRILDKEEILKYVWYEVSMTACLFGQYSKSKKNTKIATISKLQV